MGYHRVFLSVCGAEKAFLVLGEVQLYVPRDLTSLVQIRLMGYSTIQMFYRLPWMQGPLLE
jgi:hypothetical protein